MNNDARTRHFTPVLFLLAVLAATARSEEENEQRTVEQLARDARPSVVEITFTGRDGKRQGLGTGFIISPDGLIATNLHVIGEARPISVKTADDREFKVTHVHASDRGLDLAIVRIDAKDLPALSLSNSDGVKDGERIVAMGNPHGLRHSIVDGVVSGSRELEGRKMIQLAMPIEPGNSGGPVIDRRGRVLGVVTMKSMITENLGFAVAINELKPLIDRPNPVPMSRWLTIGTLNAKLWTPLAGATWRQRSGRILATGIGPDPIGKRTLCLSERELPERPFELGVSVHLEDEGGAAGLIFNADGGDRHYGFYPSRGRLRLSRFEGPTVFSWHVLHDLPSEHYRPGEWNDLKVRFEKDKFLCYVNDHLVFESADRGLPAGKPGLVKFREPAAEFRHFRIAKEIPATQVATAAKAKLDELIDQLPELSDVQADDLQALAGTPRVGAEVLRERARRLEKRAKELQQIAADLHTRAMADELVELMKQDEDKIDLIQAALLIARLDDEEMDVEPYLDQIKSMAAEINKTLMKDSDDKSRLAALTKYLFAENGFHGSRTNYYHRANSYLNNVLDDREGLPITLSVLFMELGRRIGLEIEGVGLPGHFVVRHVPQKGDGRLIDVFDGGTLLTRDDAARIVSNFAGRELRDGDLAASSKRQIVVRMLTNLYALAERGQDKEAMLRYLEAMIAADPELVRQRGVRALLRMDTGRHDAAISDLEWFLENKPDDIDLNEIRRMRQMFLQRK